MSSMRGSQTFQQKEIAERPVRTVAHLADARTFPHCAMLSHVTLEKKGMTFLHRL